MAGEGAVLLANNPSKAYSLFSDFEPVGWDPDDKNGDLGPEKDIYSLRRTTGSMGRFVYIIPTTKSTKTGDSR